MIFMERLWLHITKYISKWKHTHTLLKDLGTCNFNYNHSYLFLTNLHFLFLYRDWANEPNNLGGIQHCGLIYNNGRFGDESCDTLAYYVCKTPTISKER